MLVNMYCERVYICLSAIAKEWFMVCLQGVKMGSMRFRFDGQPINESDTPSGVSQCFMLYT